LADRKYRALFTGRIKECRGIHGLSGGKIEKKKGSGASGGLDPGKLRGQRSVFRASQVWFWFQGRKRENVGRTNLRRDFIHSKSEKRRHVAGRRRG